MKYLTKRDPKEFDDLLGLLAKAEQDHKLNEVLKMLLTEDEKQSLGLRVQIIKSLLNDNQTQREIQESLKTSVATVTRGSNMLKSMPADLLAWVKESL